jgi:hypothetical protein
MLIKIELWGHRPERSRRLPYSTHGLADGAIENNQHSVPEYSNWKN